MLGKHCKGEKKESTRRTLVPITLSSDKLCSFDVASEEKTDIGNIKEFAVLTVNVIYINKKLNKLAGNKYILLINYQLVITL